MTGIEDAIVQPGQTGVGCGVFAPDGSKLAVPSLIFKGQILDAAKAPIAVSSRVPAANEDYHYVASVPSEVIRTGYAEMSVQKMGTNQKRDFDPVLLINSRAFADCRPLCGRVAVPPSSGSWALYGLIAPGNSRNIAEKLGAALIVSSADSTNAAAAAAALKSIMTQPAIRQKILTDRSSTLRATPDWIGPTKSCSTLSGVPFKDHGAVAVYSVRLLKDLDKGENLHLVVVVSKEGKFLDELQGMTAPSTHPVCAAVLAESESTTGGL